MKIFASLAILLASFLPCLAATTVFPASTNGNNVFTGVNTFKGGLIVTNWGNGIGLTNLEALNIVYTNTLATPISDNTNEVWIECIAPDFTHADIVGKYTWDIGLLQYTNGTTNIWTDGSGTYAITNLSLTVLGGTFLLANGSVYAPITWNDNGGTGDENVRTTFSTNFNITISTPPLFTQTGNMLASSNIDSLPSLSDVSLAASNRWAIVTPEMFGAVGDGFVDDSSSVQHAISFAYTNFFNNSRPTKVILSPTRMYLCSTSLWLQGPTYLYGNSSSWAGESGTGPQLKFTGTNGILSQGAFIAGTLIDGLGIEGDGTVGGCALRLATTTTHNSIAYGGQSVLLRNLDISTFDTGIIITNIDDIRLDHIHIFKTASGGGITGVIADGSINQACSMIGVQTILTGTSAILNNGCWTLEECDFFQDPASISATSIGLRCVSNTVNMFGMNIENYGKRIYADHSQVHIGTGKYITPTAGFNQLVVATNQANVTIDGAITTCADVNNVFGVEYDTSTISFDSMLPVSSVNGNLLITNATKGITYYKRNDYRFNPMHFATNALSSWPASANTPGGSAIVNSNGYATYMLISGPGSTAWTSTNKLAPP